MTLLLLVNFLSVSANKVAWDMVREVNRVICRSISIAGYDMFYVAALPDVSNYLVIIVLVCNIGFVWCRASRFCLMSVCIGILCFVRCLVGTAFGLEARYIRYAVDGDCVRYDFLSYGYDAGLHFQDVVWSGRT